jgi:hypothetical protein
MWQNKHGTHQSADVTYVAVRMLGGRNTLGTYVMESEACALYTAYSQAAPHSAWCFNGQNLHDAVWLAPGQPGLKQHCRVQHPAVLACQPGTAAAPWQCHCQSNAAHLLRDSQCTLAGRRGASDMRCCRCASIKAASAGCALEPSSPVKA